MSDVYKKFVGRKVLAVEGSKVFLDNGQAYHFDLEGECCSSSSYTPEGLAAFKELVGATIAEVGERFPGTAEAVAEREAALVEQYPPGDVDSWHFLVFTTDKGHVTMDWRNESNGYYDGYVVVRELEPLHPVIHDALCEGRSLEEANRLAARNG